MAFSRLFASAGLTGLYGGDQGKEIDFKLAFA
jgi:hypothetical protein